MSPLQSCLVGESKPFGEKTSKIGKKKKKRLRKNGNFCYFWALAENTYIFIMASLEPKLFILKSSTQQQSYREKIGREMNFQS